MAPHPPSLTADQLAKRREVTLIKRCLAFTAFFMLAELVIGYQFHVLSLVADSYHMMNDVVAFVVQLYADNLGSLERKHGKEGTAFSFGFGRVEFLANLTQGSILFALCLTLALESMQRFYSVETMSLPPIVVVMGVLGLGWNLYIFWLFEETHDHGGHTNHSLAHPRVWRRAVMQSALEAPYSLAQSTSSRPSYAMRNLSHNHSQDHNHDHDYDDSHGHGHGHGDDHSPPPAAPRKQKPSLMGFLNPQSSLARHAYADALGSFVVVVDGLATWFFGPKQGKVSGVVLTWKGWSYVDPLCSMAVVYLILTHSVPLVTTSSYALMHAFDPVKSGRIKKILRSGSWLPHPLAGEVDVFLRDLNIWALSERSRFATVKLDVHPRIEKQLSALELVEIEQATKRVLSEIALPEQVTVEVHLPSSLHSSPRPSSSRPSSAFSSRSSARLARSTSLSSHAYPALPHPQLPSSHSHDHSSSHGDPLHPQSQV